MKKIVLALVVALMGTTMMTAQPPQGDKDGKRPPMNPEKMVEMRVNQLDKELNLTDYQKQEITKIYKEDLQNMPQRDKKEEAKGERPDEATMKARHDEMKARQDATNAKVEALLTADQKTKFAEVQKRHPHHGGPGHHGKPGGGCGMDQQGPDNGGGGCCCCKGNKGPRPEGPMPQCPDSNTSADK